MIKVRRVSGPISYRKKPTLVERAYLAGFLDAKARFTAHITHYKKRPSDQIEALAVVYGNDKNTLSMLQQAFGGTISVADRREIGGRLVYRWQIKDKEDLVSMIKQVLPHLKIKKHQAVLLMLYCSSRLKKISKDDPFVPITEEEKKIVKKLIELNRRE